METARILYLHGLHGGPKSKRVSDLINVYGSEAVYCPQLKTKQKLSLFTYSFVLLCFCFLGVAVVFFVFLKIFVAVILTIALVCIATLIYILAGRAVTHYLLTKAVVIAEKAFKKHRPNVIVASSFGAIVALNMEVPRVSLVLLAPAIDSYNRYMHNRQLASLEGYPYTIIVHGSNDDSINLDDSIRLVETCEFGKCKLELIDDTHALKTLCDGDFRDFVDEAYTRGRDEIAKLIKIAEEKKESGINDLPDLSKTDPTLYFLPPLEKSSNEGKESDSEAAEKNV